MDFLCADRRVTLHSPVDRAGLVSLRASPLAMRDRRSRHFRSPPMPEKKTIERARRDKREGKSASTQAGEFVREEIDATH